MKKKKYLSDNFIAPGSKVMACFFLWFLQALYSPSVQAHPHMFITQRIDVVFSGEGLSGLKIEWIFDDMFASMIAEDHDFNKNGRLEAKEIASVKQNAFDYISEQNYFTFIKIENKPFAVKNIENFKAVLIDKRLTYEFFIPCRLAATDKVINVSVASYDPSYYAAIFFADKEPVRLDSTDRFWVKTAVREDPDTKIYFDMVHPWTLFLEFRTKA